MENREENVLVEETGVTNGVEVMNEEETNVGVNDVGVDNNICKITGMTTGIDTSAVIRGYERKIEKPDLIKIMNGKFGGGFYARYIFDKGTGYGWIQLIIEYPTREKIGIIINKNICSETTFDSNGVGMMNDFNRKSQIKDKMVLGKCIPNMEKGFDGGDYDQFIKYERPDMPIPIKVIWEQIIKRKQELPIHSINVHYSAEELIDAMIEFGEGKDSKYKDEVGYYISRDEMARLCDEYGFTFNEARTILECKGLLDKDKGSYGYQKSKKIDGKKYNFYHLKREKNESMISEDGAIEYKEFPENIYKGTSRII